MFELHVVGAGNRHLYADELDQHHRLRHDIYIGERGWKDLVGVDGREHDQFDTDAATYLLVLTSGGEVAAGTRLLPSIGPTLLSEVFPQLADVRGFRRSRDVLEWTRFFVAPRFREERKSCRAAGVLSMGIIDHCLTQGVRTLNAVGETLWMPRISVLGWRPRPLGLTIEQDGMSICAFTFEASDHALRTTCEYYQSEPLPLMDRARARPSRPAHPRPGHNTNDGGTNPIRAGSTR